MLEGLSPRRRPEGAPHWLRLHVSEGVTPDERGHVSSFTPMLAFPPGRVCELQLLCCGFSRGSQELFVKSQHLGLPAAAVPCLRLPATS